MPLDWKDEIGNDKVEQRTWLEMPVMGMESEFNVWLDEVEIIPEDYWKHPSAFIDHPLLSRTAKSSQLPTGGAVYFDRGVIEVVTPVIELAPSSTARVVRSLWDQIMFVRNELTKWEKRTQHTVRLKAYSSHYNISYEIPKELQSPTRNIKTLALLLAYILPVPVMLAGGNRRSTGVGVRPRGNRIEVTVDFTPDPGLTIATATLIVGIVREVMSWPTYELSLLQSLPIPVVAGVIPGKHTTRKGWLTKDFHYERSPYTCDVNAPQWTTQFGETISLREMARRTTWFFRRSIRRYSDPFSFRLLFAIMNGRAPSLLELVDRPSAYEDVGHLCKWGSVIHELKSYTTEMALLQPRQEAAWTTSIDDYVRERDTAREKHRSEMASVSATAPVRRPARPIEVPGAKQSLMTQPAQRPVRSRRPRPAQSRRRTDRAGMLMPRRPSDYIDRRGTALLPPRISPAERRAARERRANHYAIPFPDRRLTRSAYEQVFLKLVSGERLRVGREIYTPIGMKGWYHAVFRRQSDGKETLMTIDQLLKNLNDWS
jgi:hypothetical protein